MVREAFATSLSLAGFGVAVVSVAVGAAQLHVMLRPGSTDSRKQRLAKLRTLRNLWRAVRIGAIAVLIILIAPIIASDIGLQKPIIGAEETGQVEEANIRQAVKASQVREFLEFYCDPTRVDRAWLDEYWLSGSKARSNVETALQHLVGEGWHYGAGSQLMRFEFRYVRFFAPDYAEAGTIEQWYLPMFHRDGSTVRERTADLGPYQIDYRLRKRHGHWLIETTTTPYVH